MLEIKIRSDELWDEALEVYVPIPEKTLRLEHSLVSISKWEMKWQKSFLKTLENGGLTVEQTIDYIKCMTIDRNVDPIVYYGITDEHIRAVNDYLANPLTATHVPDRPNKKGGDDTPTSELLYFYMVSYQIPVEFEKWPLQRLITLIKICDIKNNPPKSMSKAELAKRNTSINAARRAALNTKG